MRSDSASRCSISVWPAYQHEQSHFSELPRAALALVFVLHGRAGCRWPGASHSQARGSGADSMRSQESMTVLAIRSKVAAIRRIAKVRLMIKRYSDHAANERTFLAWVRTAIAVMAFGFLIERFDL